MTIKQMKFMAACGQTTTKVNFKQIELYQELIREEVVKELFPAIDAWLLDPLNRDKIKEVIDGAGDTLVVVQGLLYSMGINPEEVKEAIDHSNCTKIPQGAAKVLKRDDGKILKPDHFQLPELNHLVDEVLHNLSTKLD